MLTQCNTAMSFDRTKTRVTLLAMFSLVSLLSINGQLVFAVMRPSRPPQDLEYRWTPLPGYKYFSLLEAIQNRADADGHIVLAMCDEATVDMAFNFHKASLR